MNIEAYLALHTALNSSAWLELLISKKEGGEGHKKVSLRRGRPQMLPEMEERDAQLLRRHEEAMGAMALGSQYEVLGVRSFIGLERDFHVGTYTTHCASIRHRAHTVLAAVLCIFSSTPPLLTIGSGLP